MYLADGDHEVSTNEQGGVPSSSKAHEVRALHSLGVGMCVGRQVSSICQLGGHGGRTCHLQHVSHIQLCCLHIVGAVRKPWDWPAGNAISRLCRQHASVVALLTQVQEPTWSCGTALSGPLEPWLEKLFPVVSGSSSASLLGESVKWP